MCVAIAVDEVDARGARVELVERVNVPVLLPPSAQLTVPTAIEDVEH